MNLWIIGVIAIGMLAIAGVVVTGIEIVNADAEQEIERVECSDCRNTCNVERNCGLPTCGAVNSGRCNCGR